MACSMECIKNWFISFFDSNGDHRLTYGDLSLGGVFLIFTLKMLGMLPQGSENPEMWYAYIIAGCIIGGTLKVQDILKVLQK